MKLEKLGPEFTVCKLTSLEGVRLGEFCFLGRTDEEISLVCPTQETPENTTHRDGGWRGFRITGQLEFSLIGILSRISGILAGEKIGIFAVSTYNTDYILVKEENFERALDALAKSGYEITG
ncbi:MAG: ACT domain-containing protein [Ruminococcus sp.]|nr:ACT domain-containing protein [Ruminococcus sp.]